ncbi:MAG TPA: type II secretion system F family protein [Caulobacteraceae bacterium]|jgi:tight adherence protein B|nr:type II secretion system F family protein [Caulobacteraceae bacterium]
MPKIDLHAIDPRFAFLILVFAAVFAAGQAASGLVRVGQTKRAVNKRLAVVERGGSLSEIVVELRKQRGLKEDGGSVLSWAWLADLVIRSGIDFQPRRWAVMIAGLALGVTAVVFMLSKSVLFALPAGLLAAVIGPVAYLNIMAGTRAKKLGLQLPNALEVIVRSLEAGHPVPTAVSLVGREMPDPVGSEFGMAADEIAYGATLEQAVGRIADRCRHPDYDLFAATIRLQERAGGNLTGLLKMLAGTVRERQKMRLKIKAASSEGRASAMILTAAPICVFLMLTVMSPHFYGDVIGQRPVQLGLVALGSWMFIGNLVMRKMIDMRI